MIVGADILIEKNNKNKSIAKYDYDYEGITIMCH
jgi:hypothetical protein